MATFKDIIDFFNRLENNFARKAVPRIIAETATEFFKQRFTTKEWEGIPWPPTKKPTQRGSLMVRSSSLVNSIKPIKVTEEKVVISAGSSKVPYAKIHNEGGEIMHPGGTPYFPDHHGKAIFVKNSTAERYRQIFGRSLPVTQKHSIKIPRRRFMGPSRKLNQLIMDRFRTAFKGLF